MGDQKLDWFSLGNWFSLGRDTIELSILAGIGCHSKCNLMVVTRKYKKSLTIKLVNRINTFYFSSGLYLFFNLELVTRKLVS